MHRIVPTCIYVPQLYCRINPTTEQPACLFPSAHNLCRWHTAEGRGGDGEGGRPISNNFANYFYRRRKAKAAAQCALDAVKAFQRSRVADWGFYFQVFGCGRMAEGVCVRVCVHLSLFP